MANRKVQNKNKQCRKFGKVQDLFMQILVKNTTTLVILVYIKYMFIITHSLHQIVSFHFVLKK